MVKTLLFIVQNLYFITIYPPKLAGSGPGRGRPGLAPGRGGVGWGEGGVMKPKMKFQRVTPPFNLQLEKMAPQKVSSAKIMKIEKWT